MYRYHVHFIPAAAVAGPPKGGMLLMGAGG